jgi:hypothetical protein
MTDRCPFCMNPLPIPAKGERDDYITTCPSCNQEVHVQPEKTTFTFGGPPAMEPEGASPEDVAEAISDLFDRRLKAAPRGPVVNISGDVVGNVNVIIDSLVESITNNATATFGVDPTSMAQAFKVLAEAFVNDPDLAEDVKQEALENLDFLSESAATRPEQRRPSLMAASIKRLGALLTITTKAGQAWQEWQPTIEQGLRAHGH